MKFKIEIPFYIVAAVNFLLMPLLLRSVMTPNMVLMVVLPLINVTSSLIFGACAGFRIWYPFIISFLFYPSVLMYFDSTAYIYSTYYGMLAMAAMGITSFVRFVYLKITNHKKKEESV